MAKIEVTSSIDIENRLADLIDDNIMLAIHEEFERYLNPYVPMDEGVLAQSTVVTPEYVEYIMPYAHYMYEGEVYGPVFPIMDEDGIIIGWKSPPKKYPTGRAISYSTEKHPFATHHWDKAMMENRGDDFIKSVENIILGSI